MNKQLFAEIMEQAKRNRNILDIKTIKIKSKEALSPDLKAENIGELLLAILKVNPLPVLHMITTLDGRRRSRSS